MNNIVFKPLNPGNWNDFEMLFGPRGACGGCWCMAWRLSPKVFNKNKGDGNKNIMKQLVDSGTEPGIIAYVDGIPAGWCAVAPREVYNRLERSKVLAKIDDKPVWSVSCFFINKDFRRKGLSYHLIMNIIEFCRSKGASVIEAYPNEPYSDNVPAAFAWTGFPSAFLKAGFTEVARRSENRPVLRFII